MRVLICDDSAFMRRSIRQMLESDPDIQVVAVAHNGKQAVELASRHNPDVITMDIEMPEMDGLEALRRIMANQPTHVVMISSLTQKGSKASFDALRLGAADVFAKDHATVSTTMDEMRDDLIRRVRALAVSKKPAARGRADSGSPAATAVEPVVRGGTAPAKRSTLPTVDAGTIDLVVIGASTGGPPVVERVLKGVPAACRPAIVVAQHMPRMFTESMATRLNEICTVPVEHLRPGMAVSGGRVYIAPGGENTHLRAGRAGVYSVRINKEPESTVYFPSVDVLFSTAAQAAGSRTFGIVLTGMGDDGGAGAKSIRAAGGRVIAQDEASCVVYGMPKAAVQSGGAEGVGGPHDIADVLAAACGRPAAAA